MKKWQLQVAKNRLSEVVRTAQSKGPQIITQNGIETAVLISARDYRKLKGPKGDLIEFFGKSPLKGVNLNVSRAQDSDRKVEF